MPSKSLENHRKAQAERLQAILHDLLMEEENKYCADCDAKQPRWASWNLGVFVCIRCAGIHRSIGVQVSKVKSVNLDSWTPEQVQSMRVMGNAKAKAIYEAELPRDYRRPQTEQQLEVFIRAKYEHKRYILKDWQPPKVDVADLIPALEKGSNCSSFKKVQSSKTSDNGFRLPSAPSSKPSVSKQPSLTSAPVTDMQLLDFSDTAPTSSSDSGQQAANSNSLSLFTDNTSAGDISVGIGALQIAEKNDGAVDEELEDMFGPIVSAPRTESQSEPPIDINSTTATPGANCNVQQSASTNNLGDLATLNTETATTNKKSNADILALFASEPIVRPVLAPQPNPRFSQNLPYDAAQPGGSVQRSQFRFHIPGGFPTSAIPYAPNVALQTQQQFSLTSNGPVLPPVGGIMDNFMNNETFAMFAAASPFATAGGPAGVPSSNFLGTNMESLGNLAIQNTAVSTAPFNVNVGLPVVSNTMPNLNTAISSNGLSSTLANTSTDQWPSSLETSNAQKSFQRKGGQSDSSVKKDPFASLDSCFASFEQFGSSNNKTTGASRVEATTAQNTSLWD